MRRDATYHPGVGRNFEDFRETSEALGVVIQYIFVSVKL